MNRKEAEKLVSLNREKIIVEAARRRLVNFAKFVNPKLDVTRFHYVYYEVLDRFAHGKVKKLIVSVPPQTGKALKINELVLTTKGWKAHGDLQVGDYVFGDDGLPKMVKWNSGAYMHPTQRVTFADGFDIIAAPEHEWPVRDFGLNSLLETQEIKKALKNRHKPYILRGDGVKFEIQSIKDDVPQLVNCIEVEGGIYLAGRQLVPTHNSEGSSRNLPAFMLGLNPDLKICIGSYSATIARDFNRDVQRIIDTEEYAKVFPGTYLNGSNVVTITSSYLRNSDVFECVGHKGGLRVVGRGGSLTSKTVDVSILDDVYKDFAEGNSPVVREAAWRWYTSVVRTRLHNDSQELIVFTRWHEDDLIGRIEKSGEEIRDVKSWSDLEDVPPSTWLRINFEALKEGEPTELDNREPGEALWEARHSRAKLEAQKALDPTGFQCLFQGNPSSAEGRLFSAFKTYVNKEDYGTLVRIGCYVDVADEGSDYLAGATYEIRVSPNQAFNERTQRFEPIIYALITDMEYTDANTDVTTITIPDMINRNGCQRAWIESNNGGSQFEKVVKRKVRCQTIPFFQSLNKESRIITASAMVNSTIIFPVGWEHRWPKAYEDITAFLRYFKGNAHDDVIDCLVGVYEKEIADGNLKPYVAESRGVTIR